MEFMLVSRVWGPRIRAFFKALPTQYSFEVMKNQLPFEQRVVWMSYADHIRYVASNVGKSVSLIDRWKALIRDYNAKPVQESTPWPKTRSKFPR